MSRRTYRLRPGERWGRIAQNPSMRYLAATVSELPDGRPIRCDIPSCGALGIFGADVKRKFGARIGI